MSILIDKTTRVIVQGITGRDGEFHTRKMIAYGTQVVGGVSPGKGGTNVQGVPFSIPCTKLFSRQRRIPPSFSFRLVLRPIVSWRLPMQAFLLLFA